MKERGIIFNGDMVRSILSGQKTQTRRVIRQQRSGPAWSVKPTQSPITDRHTHDWWLPTGTKPYSALPCCPFGVVGDRLWVRETFGEIPVRIVYRADRDDGAQCKIKRWTPSIHMPRDYSRITLEITDVRVERLNYISEADALAEGFASTAQLTALGDDYTGLYASDRFADTWQSIYGAESWNANPWCWAITFRRVEGD